MNIQVVLLHVTQVSRKEGSLPDFFPPDRASFTCKKRFQSQVFKQSTFTLLKSLTLRRLSLKKNIIFQRFNFSILTEKFRAKWLLTGKTQVEHIFFFIQDASFK